MKNRLISGGGTVALGLLLALGPQTLFKVCPVLGDTIMRCHWSARAEIGVGALIAALGGALIAAANPRVRLGLTVGVVLAAVLALLIPHVLIGGCAMPSMACRKITFPSITMASGVLLLGMGCNLLYLLRKKA